MHNSFFVCVNEHIFVSMDLFLLFPIIHLLYLLFLRMMLFDLLSLLLQTHQVLYHTHMLFRLSEHQRSFLEFVHQIMLASTIYQEFTHFQMSLTCCKEKAGLSIVVEMIYVHSIFNQQLCHFQSTVFGSPIKRILIVFIRIIKIVFVGLKESLNYLCFPYIVAYVPEEARQNKIVCKFYSL